jgi:hypothetical protein
MQLLPITNNVSWNLMDRNKPQKNTTVVTTSFVAAKGSIPIAPKRKQPDETETPLSLAHKKTKTMDQLAYESPIGLIWDSHDYSCAYDSLLVILYNLWKDNSEAWSTLFENLNEKSKAFVIWLHGN